MDRKAEKMLEDIGRAVKLIDALGKPQTAIKMTQAEYNLLKQTRLIQKNTDCVDTFTSLKIVIEG